MNKTLIACCTVVLVALAVGAGRPGMSPAIVTSVDLGRAFNECVWLAEAEHELEREAAAHQQEADRLRAEVDLARQDIELLVPGTEQYKKAEKAYVRAAVEYRAYVAFWEARLEALRASSRMAIFERLVEAAAAYAVANGIGYIITNDSTSDLQDGNDVQIVQQLLLRRVVYASPEFDITDDLVAWINNN